MTRAILGALAGAAAAAAALVAFTLASPAVTLDMDEDLPRAITGSVYPVEQHEGRTYAWTRPLATLTFRNMDRRVDWVCTVILRGGRPTGTPPGQVTIAVDGRAAAPVSAAGDYREHQVTAPARPGSPLVLTITTSPPFVPATDPRELGAQLDRVACAPASGWIRPPVRALVAAAAAGATLGALFGLLGTTAAAAAACTVFGAAVSWILHTGLAAYTRGYLDWITPVVLWVGGPVLAWAAWRGGRMSPAGRFVLAFSAAALILKILTLLHPSKDVVDALFHAHRLEWVLAGRYYFTQPMPGGVQFPYAIGLYVSAAPFAAWMRDHVALLRIVVCVMEAAAAAVLYVAVARAWGDRGIAALAVVFYHLAPLPYVVIGNANLTYAFGQSVAVIAAALGTLLTLRLGNLPALAALFAAAALAFLSHVGIFPLLAVTLAGMGLLYRVRGDEGARASSPGILAVTVLAAVFAIAVYYAHFPEVYRTLDRVRSSHTEPAANAAAPAGSPLPVTARAGRAVALGVQAIGWPLLTLAAIGVWLLGRAPHDRLSLGLGAWLLAFVLFVAFRIAAPVDASLQRYADEFVERVYYATLPAVAILAATAAVRGWRAGAARRLAAGAAGAAAAVVGLRAWMAWIA